MTAPTNTYTQYSAVGVREDLSDVISNISPTQTPFMSNAGSRAVTATKFDWQTDALAATGTNANIEGDDSTAAAVSPTTRYENYTQIFKKTFLVSGSLEAVKKAGRKSEIAYQLAKRAKELKRDAETAFTGTAVAVAGNTTTARVTAGFDTYLQTNAQNGSGGGNYTITNGVPVTARTAGTAAAWSEAMLKAGMLAAYNAGGSPNTLMVSPAKKQATSAFAGIAVNRFNIQGAKPGVVIGAVDIYVSDFGNLEVVPNRFMPTSLAYGIDFDEVKIGTLRPYFHEQLAKTGDAEKHHVILEAGLEVSNEAAHFVCRDLS